MENEAQLPRKRKGVIHDTGFFCVEILRIENSKTEAWLDGAPNRAIVEGCTSPLLNKHDPHQRKTLINLAVMSGERLPDKRVDAEIGQVLAQLA